MNYHTISSYFVGFGSLEELAKDLRQDDVHQLRADILITSRPAKYGINIEKFNIVVSARVDGEIRYAKVVIGYRQRISRTVVEGADVPDRTDQAYRRITAWLRERDFIVRRGLYSFPSNLQTLDAVADCLHEENDEQ